MKTTTPMIPRCFCLLSDLIEEAEITNCAFKDDEDRRRERNR